MEKIVINTFLLFSITFMVLYFLGWCFNFFKYYKLTETQRKFVNIEMDRLGILGFLLSICYNVAYWMM